MNTKKKKLFKLFCVRVTKVGKLEKLQLNYKHLGEAKNFLNTIWKNAKTFLSTFFFPLALLVFKTRDHRESTAKLYSHRGNTNKSKEKLQKKEHNKHFHYGQPATPKDQYCD